MIKLKKDNIYKEVPTGFSWTTLFFGPFPAFIRGDIIWGVIILIAALCTGGLSSIVFAFIYNRYYIKGLLSKGYAPADSFASSYIKEKGIDSLSDFSGFEFKRPSNESKVEELKKWNDLFQNGAITEEEYNRKKEELLK